MAYVLNLEKLSWNATDAILKLDETFIGTKDYMGIAYFWDCEYKFILRELSIHKRRLVHNDFLANGLNVGEVSPDHEAILLKYAKHVHKNKKY